VTRNVQLFKVKRSKVKVTRSLDVSADKNSAVDGQNNFKLGGRRTDGHRAMASTADA